MLVALVIVATLVTGSGDRYNDECRGYTPTKTVRCIAVDQDPPGGVRKALAVWRCEGGIGLREAGHGDPYHGPYQYLRSTFDSHWDAMPAYRRAYDLKHHVHGMRSNMAMAIGWAARHDWSPWSCA